MKTHCLVLALLSMSLACVPKQNATQAASVDKLKGKGSDEMDAHVTTAADLKKIAGDVIYISESDSTWSPVEFDAVLNGPLTSESLQDALGIVPERKVDLWTQQFVADFWKYYTEGVSGTTKDIPNYKALKEAYEKSFQDVFIFKVKKARDSEVDVYLMGSRADGKLIGLKAKGVET